MVDKYLFNSKNRLQWTNKVAEVQDEELILKGRKDKNYEKTIVIHHYVPYGISGLFQVWSQEPIRYCRVDAPVETG